MAGSVVSVTERVETWPARLLPLKFELVWSSNKLVLSFSSSLIFSAVDPENRWYMATIQPGTVPVTYSSLTHLLVYAQFREAIHPACLWNVEVPKGNPHRENIKLYTTSRGQDQTQEH